MYVTGGVIVVLLHVALYLWRLNRTLSTTPEKLKRFVPDWTPDEIREAYKNARTSEEVSRPRLKSKKHRRYIIVGGSGTAGSWIVQHLLWRGEDPQAIRIVDIKAPERPEAQSLSFVKTDVADQKSVDAAYNTPWPSEVANLPLTVFHCAARVYVADANARYLDKYVPINVDGVRYSMEAAKKAGCDCFIATSSGSVGVKDVGYWNITGPSNFVQLLPNADPPLSLSDEFGSCYQYTKVAMENLVLPANEEGFKTGCIRPAHGVYGHGTANNQSVSWRYLTGNGGPTWLRPVIYNWVHAINVSLGHLALEDSLLNGNKGGKAYCVTEKPILYGNFYLVFETMAGIRFSNVSPLLMLIVAECIQVWETLAVYLPIPRPTGELHELQPGMLKMCLLNILFDNKLATKEIGYEPALETLEGLCMTIKDWEEKGKPKVTRGGTISC